MLLESKKRGNGETGAEVSVSKVESRVAKQPNATRLFSRQLCGNCFSVLITSLSSILYPRPLLPPPPRHMHFCIHIKGDALCLRPVYNSLR